jgi:hypothetical protein
VIGDCQTIQTSSFGIECLPAFNLPKFTTSDLNQLLYAKPVSGSFRSPAFACALAKRLQKESQISHEDTKPRRSHAPLGTSCLCEKTKQAQATRAVRRSPPQRSRRRTTRVSPLAVAGWWVTRERTPTTQSIRFCFLVFVPDTLRMASRRSDQS